MSTHDDVIVCRAVEQATKWLKKNRPILIEFRLAKSDFRQATPLNLPATQLETVLRRKINHTVKSYASALEAVFHSDKTGYHMNLRPCDDNKDDSFVTLCLTS